MTVVSDMPPMDKILSAVGDREWLSNEIARKTKINIREVERLLRLMVLNGEMESKGIPVRGGTVRAYRRASQ